MKSAPKDTKLHTRATKDSVCLYSQTMKVPKRSQSCAPFKMNRPAAGRSVQSAATTCTQAKQSLPPEQTSGLRQKPTRHIPHRKQTQSGKFGTLPPSGFLSEGPAKLRRLETRCTVAATEPVSGEPRALHHLQSAPDNIENVHEVWYFFLALTSSSAFLCTQIYTCHQIPKHKIKTSIAMGK